MTRGIHLINRRADEFYPNTLGGVRLLGGFLCAPTPKNPIQNRKELEQMIKAKVKVLKKARLERGWNSVDETVVLALTDTSSLEKRQAELKSYQKQGL